MVSACFFHVGQHQLKLVGWEEIRNLDRLQKERRCMAATEQTTAVKRRHRVDASGTAAKTSSGIKEAFIEIFSFLSFFF